MKQWFIFDRYDFLVMLVCYPGVFVANYLILGKCYFDDMHLFVPVTLLVTGLHIFFAWLKYMRYRYTELDQAPPDSSD